MVGIFFEQSISYIVITVFQKPTYPVTSSDVVNRHSARELHERNSGAELGDRVYNISQYYTDEKARPNYLSSRSSRSDIFDRKIEAQSLHQEVSQSQCHLRETH